MKKTIAMLALSLAAVSGSVLAENSYYDTASVLNAKPIYETVRVNQPQERCWNESVRQRRGGSQPILYPDNHRSYCWWCGG